MEGQLIELTGLWLKEPRGGGDKFFSGMLGSAKVLVFKNKHKKEAKHPDYKMFLAPRESEGQSSSGGARQQSRSTPPVEDDGVPF